jgi:hypothetical protein
MNLGRRQWTALAIGLFWAGSAAAAPLTFTFTFGTATITASTDSVPVLGSTTVDLTGTFVVFDPAPGGPLVAELVDFAITAGPTSTISLSTPYGGYDQFVIESVTLSPGTGYATTGATGGLPIFDLDVGPIDIDAVYSASYSAGPPPPPASNVSIMATSSNLGATVLTDTMQLLMDGVTLFTLAGGDFGEAEDLVVKADIEWFGTFTPIPEPGTASLLALGLAAIGVRSRGQRLSGRPRVC